MHGSFSGIKGVTSTRVVVSERRLRGLKITVMTDEFILGSTRRSGSHRVGRGLGLVASLTMV